MGKYQWHATVKDRKPEVVRHYNHLTKLYRFILRNPTMFGGQTLTIFNHHEPVINLTYDEIRKRAKLADKETIERKEVLRMGRESK